MGWHGRWVCPISALIITSLRHVNECSAFRFLTESLASHAQSRLSQIVQSGTSYYREVTNGPRNFKCTLVTLKVMIREP